MKGNSKRIKKMAMVRINLGTELIFRDIQMAGWQFVHWVFQRG